MKGSPMSAGRPVDENADVVECLRACDHVGFLYRDSRSRTRPLRNRHMVHQQASKQSRNRARTRKNAAKVEQYLTEVEKIHGGAKAWELRERLELGQTTLGQLRRP